MSLQITAPVLSASTDYNILASTSYVNGTQLVVPNMAISDADTIQQAAKGISFAAVVGGGIANVSVSMHNAKLFDLTPDKSGEVSATLDFSQEFNGPLVVEVNAFDVPPGGQQTVQITARLVFVIEGGKTYVRGTPAGATGFSKAFEDDFTVSPPSIAASYADVSKTWGASQVPSSLNYGDASFEFLGGQHDVFTIWPPTNPSFLRIRSGFDANNVDLWGFNRQWYGGGINSAQPSGAGGAPASPVAPTINSAKGGYWESRVLAPKGATPWPAIWSLPLKALGISEIDIAELYGIATAQTYQTFFPADRANATNPAGGGWGPYIPPNGPDTSWEFLTYGLRIGAPGAADAGMISIWVDDVQVPYTAGVNVGKPWSVPVPAGTSDDLAMQITHARGSGWPERASPAGYEDMFMDYVTVWLP